MSAVTTTTCATATEPDHREDSNMSGANRPSTDRALADRVEVSEGWAVPRGR
jgi:hypothetical protein